MRRAALIVSLFLTVHGACSRATAAGGLVVRPVSPPRLVGDQVIVGRSACGGATWLLTEQPALVRVSIAARQVTVHPVRGLRSDERPWGLVCLPDGTLWTLTAPGLLARLASDGLLAERIPLPYKSLALFGSADRLLFQPTPYATGRPALRAARIGTFAAAGPWPGPLTQAADTPADQMIANLLNCGIGSGDYLPCWFAAHRRITISDGTLEHVRTLHVRPDRFPAVDAATPVRDVALAGMSRVWILTTGANRAAGRRAGSWLTRSDWRAEEATSIALAPAARLILWATSSECVLLSTRGELLEVAEP
jgi:hypothetical protein